MRVTGPEQQKGETGGRKQILHHDEKRVKFARKLQKIEDLIRELADEISIVIVTHNMQQAARVSDVTAFMLLGELVEHGDSRQIFTNPKDERTEAYITGRFG